MNHRAAAASCIQSVGPADVGKWHSESGRRLAEWHNEHNHDGGGGGRRNWAHGWHASTVQGGNTTDTALFSGCYSGYFPGQNSGMPFNREFLPYWLGQFLVWFWNPFEMASWFVAILKQKILSSCLTVLLLVVSMDNGGDWYWLDFFIISFANMLMVRILKVWKYTIKLLATQILYQISMLA